MTRKSKREIEQKLDELDPDPADEYPVLDTLAELLGYDWETVEEGEQLVRRKETGQIYYFPPECEAAVSDLFDGD